MQKYVVRHGVMRTLGVYNTSRGENFTHGDRVVVRTDRGLEAGEILCVATDETTGQLQDPQARADPAANDRR